MSDSKTILITGSTDGIGYKAAVDLINLGYEVIIHGRSPKRSQSICEKIMFETGTKNIEAITGDLSSITQIKELIDDIKKNYTRIDVLINNAGVLSPNRVITEDGFELTLQVNYLAPFLLTNSILDILKDNQPSRIINVVSEVHSSHLDLNDLQSSEGYTSVKAYALSKTCLIMYTYLLAEHLRDFNITVNCLHPGVIKTKLLHPSLVNIGGPVEVGAKTLVYAATSPELENTSGKYLRDNKIRNSKEVTNDKRLQKLLWEKTTELLGANNSIF